MFVVWIMVACGFLAVLIAAMEQSTIVDRCGCSGRHPFTSNLQRIRKPLWEVWDPLLDRAQLALRSILKIWTNRVVKHGPGAPRHHKNARSSLSLPLHDLRSGVKRQRNDWPSRPPKHLEALG